MDSWNGIYVEYTFATRRVHESDRHTVGANRFFVTKSYILRSGKDIFKFFFLNKGEDL